MTAATGDPVALLTRAVWVKSGCAPATRPATVDELAAADRLIDAIRTTQPQAFQQLARTIPGGRGERLGQTLFDAAGGAGGLLASWGASSPPPVVTVDDADVATVTAAYKLGTGFQ
jgi:hypothetical protein